MLLALQIMDKYSKNVISQHFYNKFSLSQKILNDGLLFTVIGR